MNDEIAIPIAAEQVTSAGIHLRPTTATFKLSQETVQITILSENRDLTICLTIDVNHLKKVCRIVFESSGNRLILFTHRDGFSYIVLRQEIESILRFLNQKSLDLMEDYMMRRRDRFVSVSCCKIE